MLQDGAPLKFHSVGQDFFQGSHYDEYNYKWVSYKPGPVDPAVFELPQMCKDLPSSQAQQQQPPGQDQAAAEAADAGRHHHAMQAIAVLPGNHHAHSGACRHLCALQPLGHGLESTG